MREVDQNVLLDDIEAPRPDAFSTTRYKVNDKSVWCEMWLRLPSGQSVFALPFSRTEISLTRVGLLSVTVKSPRSNAGGGSSRCELTSGRSAAAPVVGVVVVVEADPSEDSESLTKLPLLPTLVWSSRGPRDLCCEGALVLLALLPRLFGGTKVSSFPAISLRRRFDVDGSGPGLGALDPGLERLPARLALMWNTLLPRSRSRSGELRLEEGPGD